jgi:hypothetical protein
MTTSDLRLSLAAALTAVRRLRTSNIGRVSFMHRSRLRSTACRDGLIFWRPIGLLAVMASVCGAAALSGACIVNNAPATPDGGAVTPGADGGSDARPGSAGALGFTPSNVDLSGIDLTKVGDFVVDAVACSINTDNLLASCGNAFDAVGFKLAKQSDGSTVAVYVAKSITIRAGKDLNVVGSHPLVFIALDTITITGSLSASSREDVAEAGGQVSKVSGKGAGPGGGGAPMDLQAGGGGSYCGVGGAGAAESGATAPGGPTYGSASIAPLLAGSEGGKKGLTGGAGGGAVQLVAGTSITIEASGVVSAGAGGGGLGGIGGQGANAGGSGGAILLEAPAVTMAGTLAANGGGGGGAALGGGEGGKNATPNATPAAGGASFSPGGAGSGAASIKGVDGTFTPHTGTGAGAGAGAGGGGAGRIRINTTSGAATLTGVLSPAVSTPCATQGTLQ